MTPKYGLPLTNESWKGWPLRVGEFAANGKMEGLTAAEDTVLVWSGGKSDVELHARAERQTQRLRFVRHGGMIDLLPKGVAFDQVSWSGQASECVAIPFDGGTIERLLGKKAAFRPDRLRTAVSDPHVVDLARRLHAQARTGMRWGSLYVEALSLTLASYVYGRYTSQTERRAQRKSLPLAQSQRLVEFVEDNLGENLSLAGLALMAGYSPDHFARLFKATVGLSPHQYILERRIDRAKTLLRERNHSMVDVAILCGFASQAHLNVAFKARTGVTPGAYRKV